MTITNFAPLTTAELQLIADCKLEELTADFTAEARGFYTDIAEFPEALAAYLEARLNNLGTFWACSWAEEAIGL